MASSGSSPLIGSKPPIWVSSGSSDPGARRPKAPGGLTGGCGLANRPGAPGVPVGRGLAVVPKGSAAGGGVPRPGCGSAAPGNEAAGPSGLPWYGSPGYGPAFAYGEPGAYDWSAPG